MSISIENLNNAFMATERGGPVTIDSDVAFSGGGSYTQGYLRFTLDDAQDGDQFKLPSAADPNAAGAISVDGSDVYLGNGSGRERIGSIDVEENGQDGQPLKILFSIPLPNSGFEDGANSWVIKNEEYGDNGNEIDLSGFVIDLAHDSAYSGGSGTVKVQTNNSVTFSGSIAPGVGVDNSHALYLASNGNILRDDADPQSGFKPDGYGSIHGPYATSDVITVKQNDALMLDFSADGSGDTQFRGRRLRRAERFVSHADRDALPAVPGP